MRHGDKLNKIVFLRRFKSMARERSKNREEGQAIEPRRRGQLSRMESWPAFSPFSMMRRMADEMDRMFEGFGFPHMERFGPWTSAERFSPEVDIFERDGKLVISADLPGLTKDDVKVDIAEDGVIIEGERKYEHEENEEGVYRSERGYGHFRRYIPLPEGVKTDTTNATFKNGVLEVTLDAPQLSKGRRRIEIQGEGQKPEKAA
jgi:HSP20 family protein